MFAKTTETPSALNDDVLATVVGGSDADDQVWNITDINVNEGARARDGGDDDSDAGLDIIVWDFVGA